MTQAPSEPVKYLFRGGSHANPIAEMVLRLAVDTFRDITGMIVTEIAPEFAAEIHHAGPHLTVIKLGQQGINTEEPLKNIHPEKKLPPRLHILARHCGHVFGILRDLGGCERPRRPR